MNKAILVNKENKIKESFYKYLELITVKNKSNEELQIEKETYDNYLKLEEHLKEKSIDIDIEKAYISTAVENSEYNTALALSIKIDSTNYEELHKVLFKYGFILRYPKGKESITGYEYNPTHIRYVGKELAKYIYDNNLTLEEYYKKSV